MEIHVFYGIFEGPATENHVFYCIFEGPTTGIHVFYVIFEGPPIETAVLPRRNPKTRILYDKNQ